MRVKAFRWLWRGVEYVVVAAAKTVVMCAVFLFGAGLLMRWLGYDVPGVHQLQEYFRSVGRLSDIFS